MSFDRNILLFLEFGPGFPDGQEERITNALRSMYDQVFDEPNLFKKLLDDWVWVVAKGPIKINYLQHKAQAKVDRKKKVGLGIVELDVNYCESALFITNKGEAVMRTLDMVLIHELVHALTGKLDDGAGTIDYKYKKDETDYKGSCVIEANKIFKQLGFPEMHAYISQDPTGYDRWTGRYDPDRSILSAGTQYTNGEEIDYSVVTYFRDRSALKNAPGTWDTSNLGNFRDLLIGDRRDNTLKSGGGDDFLYGMDGEDKLYGGEGNDYLNGGEDDDYLEGGQGHDTYVIGQGHDIIMDTGTPYLIAM